MRRECALATALLMLEMGVALLAQPARGQVASSDSGDDAQVIAGPIPEKITSSSVVVWWQTAAPQETILVYGTAPEDMPTRVQRPWKSTRHEVSLRKLQSATTYYLAILLPDGSKVASAQFTTQPGGYAAESALRITNGPLFEQIAPDFATITWSTNLPSASLVRYGTDPQELQQTKQAPWAPTTHRITLRGLQPDTHYYFAIEPTQLSQEAEQPAPASLIYSFHTLPRGQQAVNLGLRH